MAKNILHLRVIVALALFAGGAVFAQTEADFQAKVNDKGVYCHG